MRMRSGRYAIVAALRGPGVFFREDHFVLLLVITVLLSNTYWSGAT